MPKQPRPHPTALRVREVAVYLNVSRSHVYRLIREGTLHSTKVGNSRRIPRESFEEYLRDINWRAEGPKEN
jgi:excisionase family DNA binding protein